MKNSTIILEVPESRLHPLVSELREAIKTDCGTEYSETAIRRSVVRWLHSTVDQLFEDAFERLTQPSWDEAREFARMLEEDRAKAQPGESPSVVAAESSPIFTGNRTFSLEKMAAMISHIASSSQDLFKTKLNKLLFYSDFVHYYLHGQSISGSRYVHLPYGPVPDGYEETLDTLNHYGVIDIQKQHSSDLVRSGENSATQFLSPEESASLDWVISQYGKLSASQLTELSHKEKAYRHTKTGEEIAYEYAKFFENLPKNLG